ncbi:hypothetical protein ACTXL6_00305 [Brachybacterium tyrofermentans]|uniref:hypothetical protein n=1 Tax=Brachybacterium tyrofermentans TaxID=47848 RepID=UPI003FD46082
MVVSSFAVALGIGAEWENGDGAYRKNWFDALCLLGLSAMLIAACCELVIEVTVPALFAAVSDAVLIIVSIATAAVSDENFRRRRQERRNPSRQE